MKEAWPALVRRWKEALGKYGYVLLVIGVGAALLLWPGGGEKETVLTEESGTYFDLEEFETKLEKALSRIEGAGEVSVVLTLASDGRQVLAQDRDTDGGGGGSSTTVTVGRGGGTEEVVPLQTFTPDFRGALVICQGGGEAQVRLRLVEAVSAVRRRLPDIPIDYKLAVRQEDPHYGNAGVLESELDVFVPLLEQAGVTSFHVTLANHSDLSDTIPPANHPEFGQEGCFLKFCDQVRRYTALPICGVGGLTRPDFVEEHLTSGRIQCAAMSRQLIADPDWPEKVRSGRVSELHRCVRCNKECLGGMMAHRGVHCIYEKKETVS